MLEFHFGITHARRRELITTHAYLQLGFNAPKPTNIQESCLLRTTILHHISAANVILKIE